MLKKILVVFVAMMLIGFASAEIEELKPVKINDCINLPQIEYNSTYQNLTFILKPNGQIEPINKYMTKNGYSYNYSYCNTGIIGTYTANGCSDVSCWNYEFKVTPSGFEGLGTFLFVFIVIILLIFLIGFRLENAWIMSLGSILIIIFGFFIVKFGVDIIKDTQTTWAIGLVVWAIGIYSLYLSAEEQLKQWG